MKTDHDEEDFIPAEIPPAYPIEEHIERAVSGTQGSELQRQLQDQRPAVTSDDFAIEAAPVDPPPAGLARMMDGLPEWQLAFVVALLDCQGVIQLAAKAAGVSTAAIRRAREDSDQFDMAVIEALEQCKGVYEAALIQSAVVGVRTPVFQGGICVGYKRVRDVKALQYLLEAKAPEEYGPKDDSQQQLSKIATAEVLKGALHEAGRRLFLAAQGIGEKRAKARQIR